MTVILLFVQCDGESGSKVKEGFGGYLRINGSSGKGLLNVIRSENVGLNISDCLRHCYDNRANIKRKEAGRQARNCVN